MDIRAQQAREHHREAAALAEQAARHRELRDRLIRTLRADDPRRWTYPALAAAVGCSPELIAHIVKTGIVKTGIVKTGGGAKTES